MKVAKDDITIRIQPPHKGPFYVSPKTVDQFISNLGKWVRWYKYASTGLSIFYLYLVTKHVILYLMEIRFRWELQKRLPPIFRFSQTLPSIFLFSQTPSTTPLPSNIVADSPHSLPNGSLLVELVTSYSHWMGNLL
ncbi:mitochondrial ubiquitin ligase activator of NFKB 1 [Cucumis melo var. makuwa]|uniref:RING-type E3 ubiquitin transferase n=1 Tax=Cucumis melo var. makuwa TaxID=1194695 RepID=A0A5A7U4U6_CUCMM|nr:mitochondrial ubiquitin ligase activator of NFKB 1 [Cucumis melo var. makuwa]